MLPQGRQNGLHLGQMFNWVIRLRENTDIVHVHYTVARSNVVSENEVHQPLEGRRRGCKAKRSRHPLVVTRRGNEGRLVAVRLTDAELMKTAVQVDLGKQASTPSPRNQVRCRRRRKTVADCLGIELPVVHTQAQ